MTLLVVSLVMLLGFSGWSVEVSIRSAPKDGSPGSFVTHVFGLINNSPDPVTYSLEFLVPTAWGTLGAPTSIALQPDEEGTLFVTATIPPDAIVGQYDLQLTATSQSDLLDSGTASGIVFVAPMTEIELLAPTGTTISQGTSVTYELVIANRGNVQDSFTISATSTLGLMVMLSHTTVDLAPQESLTFAVQLTAMIEASPGRDTLDVVAASTLFDGVSTGATIYTSVLPPGPDAIRGTVMEQLPARIRWSIDKNVMTGVFDSQMTFSTSGQIVGGYFASFFSMVDPFGPSLAGISSYSMLYRRNASTFSIGNVSQTLTDLLTLSCTGGTLMIDAEYYELSMIAGGSHSETRFAGHFSLGPDAVNVGVGYLGIRDPLSVSKSIWTATAHAEPLDDWTLTLEGGLGLDGPLTSRAIFFSTTIDSEGYFFSGRVFSAGTHFPGQRADSAGIEISQRLRLPALSLSTSLSHKWDNVDGNPLLPTRIQDDLGFNLTTTPLKDGPTLSSTIDFSWDRYADLSLKSDIATLISASMTETSGVFPYSLSGKVLEQVDHVLGSRVRTTTYSEGAGLSIDAFYLYLRLTQNQTLDMITDTQLSSSSDLSIHFQPETALHEASVIFSNSRNDFDLSASFNIHLTDDLDVAFDGSVSWDRHDATDISFGWGISFNANVTIPLPFLVTKGRIEGRAFIDRDGDGIYGLNDEPAGTIVVAAGGSTVSTNADGYFRFPPLYPGDYTIAPEQLPSNATAGAPISVSVVAGETIRINVPLMPTVVVSGEVFEDLDRSGTRNLSEGGIAQAHIILQSHTDASIADAYTDLSGTFGIPGIVPGTYHLSVDANSLPDQFEFTTSAQATVVIGARAPQPVVFGGFIREVVALQPPTADFAYGPQDIVVGEPVTFDGTDSSDPDGVIVSYAWDFDADGVTDSTDMTAEFTFQQPGTFDITLTVTDDSGNEDTVGYTVTVASKAVIDVAVSLHPPLADFSYMPAQPLAGETVLFDATTSKDLDGAIIAYAWDFDENGIIDATASIASYAFPSPGTYHISLSVTDIDGNLDTVTYSITVGGDAEQSQDPPATTRLPIASFQISPTEPASGDTILFNGTSSLSLSGLIESFAWDFDGDTEIDATAPIAEHTFATPGDYSVTLIVTDSNGNTGRTTKVIQVSSGPSSTSGTKPTADFAYLPAAPEAGDVMLFNATLSTDSDGQVVTYAWDFDGDGNTDSRAAIVDHAFPEDGVYNVSLSVIDDSGNSDTLTKQVVVGSGVAAPPPVPDISLPPVASFTYAPQEPQTGSVVLFNGTLSTDPDGTVIAYAWNFDGDSSIDSTAAIAEHVFSIQGSYNVSLTVTDDSGATDTLTRPVDVLPAEIPATSLPPVADFEYSPVAPVAGELVLFNGLLSTDIDGEILAFAWDFDGDGIIDSTDSFSNHVFASAGTFNISLTVTDDSGASDTFIQPVFVDVEAVPPSTPPSSFQPPIADFTFMPEQPEAGELVLFNASSSWDFDGEIVAYSWDFNGDGSPDASTVTAEHIFPSPGTFSVSLTVTDNSGASDTLSIPFTVE